MIGEVLPGSARVAITGIGAKAPDRVVTNHDLAELVETNDEWVVERTGIRERRFAAEGEALSDYAIPAARIALAQAGLEGSDIDLVIVCTLTPDMVFPCTAALVGDARDQAVVAALTKHEAARLFSEMECTSAEISQDAVAAGLGPVVFYFDAKAGDSVYDRKAGAQVTAQWRMDGSQMRVGSLALTLKPVVRGRRPGDEAKTFVPSAEVAKPRQAETSRGGVATKVTESDPAAIAHLADTPEPLRQKIDKLVADVIASADPESPGALWGRATAQLKEIGKPAMPRLMNALFELYSDVQGNNQKISQVTRSLLDLTGMAFAYDVRGTGDAAKDKPARESVIRQWFAWWWRYANDNYQTAIDQSEDLLDAPSKPKADPKKAK